jgi:hypothetical protein
MASVHWRDVGLRLATTRPRFVAFAHNARGAISGLSPTAVLRQSTSVGAQRTLAAQNESLGVDAKRARRAMRRAWRA